MTTVLARCSIKIPVVRTFCHNKTIMISTSSDLWKKIMVNVNLLLYTPWRHTEEWKYSSTNFNLRVRHRWVVTVVPQPLWPPRKDPGIYSTAGFIGTQCKHRKFGEKWRILPLPGIAFTRPTHSLITIPSYPGSHMITLPNRNTIWCIESSSSNFRFMGHLDIMALYEKTQFYSLYHISHYDNITHRK